MAKKKPVNESPGSERNLAKLNNDQFGGKRPKKPIKSAPITEAETSQNAGQTQRREQYESSAPGKARMSSPIHPLGSMSLADHYKMNGFTDDSIHPMGQQELPGMSTLKEARDSGMVSKTGGRGAIPDMENQRKWEDMHPTEQAHTLRQAAAFGVNVAHLHAAIGSQLDQAYHRAANYTSPGTSAPTSPGRSVNPSSTVQPAGATFFSHTGETRNPDGTESENMTPRGRIVSSAKKNGVPFSAQALANAQTSPKSKFQTTPKSGANKGKTIYPNDANASYAINHVQAGNNPLTATNVPGIGGMHGNNQRAAYAFQQQLAGNHTVDELRNPPNAKGETSKVLGPKTGSYHGAWVDPHSSVGRATSDIHTGGGGFVPHLNLGEREDYLGINGIHELHDHVLKHELQKRGLQSLHHGQAAQWTEERINRGEVSEHEAYGTDSHSENRMNTPHQFHTQVPGQQGLF